MAYLGTPPRSRVLSSADIGTGAVTLDDISFTDQPTSVNVSGTIDKHTMRLSDQVVIDGDLDITDNLILSKISDDGNAIILTNDSSTRTITGTGSLEASTLTQTPNASLTGMTGELGSGVTGIFKNIQTFTSGSSATYTKTAGTNKILVHCTGGGGGGGGYSSSAQAGGGGGSGGTAIRLYDYSSLTTGTFTVGGGGSAGSGHGNGGGGDSSTFTDGTTVITGSGGGGGKSPQNGNAGGGGGDALNGVANINGQAGQLGINGIDRGVGGNSYWGSYGAGGEGAYNPSPQASVGNAGIIIIYEF